MKTISSSVVALIVTLVILSGCVNTLYSASGTKEQVTAHLPNAPVIVQTRNGAIEVIRDAGIDSVQVTTSVTAGGTSQQEADDRLAQTQLTVDRDTSRTLTISVTFPEPRSMRDAAAITVRLPDAEGVEATTSNGTISITGLSGKLVASTSNGAVTVTDHSGEGRITTSNGAVRIERHSGAVNARTSNGAIRLVNQAGPVTAQTSNGRIELALAPDQSGPIDLRSSNGRIVVSVGPAFAGELSLNTSNGSLTIKDGAAIIAKQELGRRSGTVTMAAAGETSRLRTSNGRIEFETIAAERAQLAE